jgi:hypothetical protein
MFDKKFMVCFTTGAFITPVEINGKWHWVVSGFEDDTYDGSGDYAEIVESAENMEDLIREEDYE